MRRFLESSSRPAALRFGALLALLVGGVLLVSLTSVGALLSEEGIKSLIQDLRASWWAPIVLIGLFVVVSALGLPPAPLLVGGALFGAAWGTLYNITGLFLGAAVSFHLANSLGREAIVRWTGGRLRRVESALKRHGFLPLVQTRFLPLPFTVVNFGAALAGVPAALFLSSSLVGLAPSTAVHTFFIAELIAGRMERVWVGAGYVGSFAVFNLAVGIPFLRQRLRRRRPYRELMARRAR